MLVSNGSQARDAVKHSVMHRTVSVTKNYPGPNVSSSKTEKPWSRQITRIRDWARQQQRRSGVGLGSARSAPEQPVPLVAAENTNLHVCELFQAFKELSHPFPPLTLRNSPESSHGSHLMPCFQLAEEETGLTAKSFAEGLRAG